MTHANPRATPRATRGWRRCHCGGSLARALALLGALGPIGLGAGGAPAAGSVVDPWRTTLVDLGEAADAIARARLAPTADEPHRLEVVRLLWLREGLPRPASALGDDCTTAEAAAAAREAGSPSGAVEGIVFLVLDEGGGGAAGGAGGPSGAGGAGGAASYRVLGSGRGFVAGDPHAEAFVRGALEHASAEPEDRVGFLLDEAASAGRSARVREDALREAVEAIGAAGGAPWLGKLGPERAATALEAARASLEGARASADPEPGLAMLALLPEPLGEPELIEAAVRGLAPRLAGAALAAHPRAAARLAERLIEAAGGPAPEAERAAGLAAAARALGHARDRAATPALVAALGSASAEVRLAALDALASLRDPAAVPTLTPLVRGPALDDEAALAAVALAFTGGDQALGALEFAALHHPDPQARALLDRLLAEPAAVRVELGGGR